MNKQIYVDSISGRIHDHTPGDTCYRPLQMTSPDVQLIRIEDMGEFGKYEVYEVSRPNQGSYIRRICIRESGPPDSSTHTH